MFTCFFNIDRHYFSMLNKHDIACNRVYKKCLLVKYIAYYMHLTMHKCMIYKQGRYFTCLIKVQNQIW